MKEIVDRIRNLCKQNGTSITKLEEKLGYANGTIGKWAKAKRKPPLEKVIDIARELDTTVEYVMNGEQKEKPAPGGELNDAELNELIELAKSLDSPGRKFLIKNAKGLLEMREQHD